MVDAATVDQWMAEQVKKLGTIDQEDVAEEIEKLFGEEFVYERESGNLGISDPVLRKFRELTGDTVVWERGEKCWRLRNEYDEEGRAQ